MFVDKEEERSRVAGATLAEENAWMKQTYQNPAVAIETTHVMHVTRQAAWLGPVRYQAES